MLSASLFQATDGIKLTIHDSEETSFQFSHTYPSWAEAVFEAIERVAPDELHNIASFLETRANLVQFAVKKSQFGA